MLFDIYFLHMKLKQYIYTTSEIIHNYSDLNYWVTIF